MPSVILLGSLLMNTPQQNAGAFVGEYNFAGWDANRKMSQAHGGEFGFFNWSPGFYNLNLDSFEVVDGAMNDADAKPVFGSNL
ncbi:hypothetical protein [Alicyclobacillus acidocaldarius]|uniref:Uncharacterized protein n=1 Tax=Alicyclobacillus acidocaldarius subsp. acidocaldarius (strain ATCC 27009 / DSM 446 / BCRC 14685 / JCM 5260 / KCTC 1825 / NBRC 15652 / NCIMB 11725 / NRRL B-14509 / 104-IA) TaxID=521098 RepID=C8WSL8_ALIAD|nr:hypothetical protein [Alicyclobacillus acidocaldarius]ACV59503.1 hypothetical protein Aaci_2497 [Alicyclobacillus acidocaldarius subsp. acidocaldarius DSM 446]